MAIRLTSTAASAALSLALAALASGCGSEEKAATPASAPMPAAAPAPPAAAMPAAPQAAAPQAAAMPEAAEMPEPAAAAPAELPSSRGYPLDFPTDVPRYPGSKVTGARGSGEEGFAVTIDAPDTVASVAKYFGDGLTASGWETVVQEMPEGTMIIATKDESRAQALVHAKEGGESGALVELIVGRPQ